MKRRLTSDQRVNLARKLWFLSLDFALLGLILGWVAVAIVVVKETLLPLIVVPICCLISIALNRISSWMDSKKA